MGVGGKDFSTREAKGVTNGEERESVKKIKIERER